MARISPEELEALKSRTDLVVLVEQRGVALSKKGQDLVGRCPFHEDGTPSLVVTPSKNLWHCFGCGAGGDVVQWVMKAQGVSFRHAVELLREGASSSSSVSTAKVSTTRTLPAPVSLDADDTALLSQVADYYHRCLLSEPQALSYLVEKRGISREAIAHFKLGFSNRTLGLRLPMKNRADGERIRSRLQALGVLRDTGHEHLRGRVTVPLLDEGGAIVGLYGRLVTASKTGAPSHLYLPGPHRGVFNAAGVVGADEAILCESLLDALTFWSAGLHAVTTSYGVEGLTDDVLSALVSSKASRVIVAYDRDEAGDRGAVVAASKLQAAGFTVLRALFPKGLDANAYAMKVQPASRALRLVVEKATVMHEGTRPALPSTQTMPKDAAEAAKEEETSPPPSAAPAPSTTTTSTATTSAPPSSSLSSSLSPASSQPASKPSAAYLSTMRVERETADELVVASEARRWRVRGVEKNLSHEVLKVNVLVQSTTSGAFFVDTVDLYASRQRGHFLKVAAAELGCGEEGLRAELSRLLLLVEQKNDEVMRSTLSPRADTAPELTDDETSEALALLRAPDLLDRVLEDFERCGVVGEHKNKLVGLLAAVSRKLDDPLAVVIQSSSAAGKSSLMEAILAFVPDEEKVKYSSMTGQSLFYMSDVDLRHKVLALVEEEGAKRASYPLKLLQSEKELTIAATGKDPATGRLTTHEYRVEGPVMLMMTTTAAEIDEELMNRCLVLSVNEEREQTAAIHALQRRRQTLAGQLERHERAAIVRLHQNAQRLLEPLIVTNPWAERLTFLDDKTRTRRDHGKYLTLIRAVTLVHQHQRPMRTVRHRGETVRYIEATLDDIAVANRLAHECLGRSLDVLSPQTRRVLQSLHRLVDEKARAESCERHEVRFTRREAMAVAGISLTQLQVHLARLVDHELVILHRQTHGLGFVYELAWNGEGEDGRPFMPGLIDVDDLRESTDRAPRATTTTADLSGVKVGGVGGQSGRNRPRNGGESGPAGAGAVDDEDAEGDESSTLAGHDDGRSYAQAAE